MNHPNYLERRDGRTTDTRARLLTTALELFVQEGFEKTTLQDIADRLGLTKAALYYHFRSKAELIRGVVQPAVEEINAFFDEAHGTTMPLREFLERYFDLVYAHRLVFLALVREPSGLTNADAETWVTDWATRVEEVLAGPDPGNEERIRVMTAASGLARCAFLLSDIPLDELRATAVSIAHATLTGGDYASEGR